MVAPVALAVLQEEQLTREVHGPVGLHFKLPVQLSLASDEQGTIVLSAFLSHTHCRKLRVARGERIDVEVRLTHTSLDNGSSGEEPVSLTIEGTRRRVPRRGEST